MLASMRPNLGVSEPCAQQGEWSQRGECGQRMSVATDSAPYHHQLCVRILIPLSGPLTHHDGGRRLGLVVARVRQFDSLEPVVWERNATETTAFEALFRPREVAGAMFCAGLDHRGRVVIIHWRPSGDAAVAVLELHWHQGLSC